MMLTEVHGLDPQVSTLIYILNGLGLVIATPFAAYSVKYNWLTRRAVAYLGFIMLAIGMFIRTGDFFTEPLLWMAILGQVISGMGISIMKIVSLPELVDSVEQQPELYSQLDIEHLHIFVSSVQQLAQGAALGLGVFMATPI